MQDPEYPEGVDHPHVVRGLVLENDLRPAGGAVSVALLTDGTPQLQLATANCDANSAFAFELPESSAGQVGRWLILIAKREEPLAVSFPAALVELGPDPVVLRLRPGAWLSARATSPTGGPVETAEFVVLQEPVPGPKANWQAGDALPVVQAHMSAHGGQLRCIVRPGPIVLRARIPGGPLGPVVPARAAAGGEVDVGAVPVGSVARRLRVRVVDASGAPIPGAWVRTSQPLLAMDDCHCGGSGGIEYQADGQGVALLPPCPEEFFPLEVAAGSPSHGVTSLRVLGGGLESVEPIPVDLTLPERPWFWLLLESGGLPVPVAPYSVLVLQAGASTPASPGAEEGSPTAVLEAVSRSQDGFYLSHLPPGQEYRVNVDREDTYVVKGMLRGGVRFRGEVQAGHGDASGRLTCDIPPGRLVALDPARSPEAQASAAPTWNITWIPSRDPTLEELQDVWRADGPASFWVPWGYGTVALRSRGPELVMRYQIPDGDSPTVAVDPPSLDLAEVHVVLTDGLRPLLLRGIPIDVGKLHPGLSLRTLLTREDGTVTVYLTPGRYQFGRSRRLADPIWTYVEIRATEEPYEVRVRLW